MSKLNRPSLVNLEPIVRHGADRKQAELFMCIGYNKTVEDKTTKHYRRYYPDELEEVEEVMPGCPFLKETIYRVAESGGRLFGGDGDPSQNVAIKAGVFEGLVKVYNE